MNIGSLFSGAGGLDMAVEHIFGATTAWHCENDAAATKVLAAHWPGVPNHGDITGVDWAAVQPVTILCGGWPCQPFSRAGRRKGADDERALWPHVTRAIRVVRPRIVVLENVPAVLGPEFSRVANHLAALGYDLTWVCLRAAEVGAPHHRERVFIVAHPADAQRPQPRLRYPGPPTITPIIEPLLPTPATADGDRGPDFARASRERSGADDLITICARATRGRGSHWGKYAPAIRRWEQRTRPAPSPTEPNTRSKPRLAPPFSEWMMGWPAGWVTAVPGVGRNDQLRIIGNGVVPQQATAALAGLLAREVAA